MLSARRGKTRPEKGTCMPVRETSRAAFHEFPRVKRLTQESRVLEIIRQHPGGICDDAIRLEYQTRWGERITNALVSARRNTLLEDKKVYDGGKRMYEPTGKTVIHWRPVIGSIQRALFHEEEI